MIRVRNRLLVLGIFLSLAGAATSPAATLDFLDTFETYGLGTDLNGTGGWAVEVADVATANRGLVTNDMGGITASEGTKFTFVTNATLSQSFTDDATIASVSFDIMPVLTTATPSFPTDSVAVAWFYTNGNLRLYDGPIITTITSVAISTGEWVKMVFSLDYGADTYDAHVNGSLAADDFAFYTNISTDFTEISFRSEGVSGFTLVDAVSASAASPLVPEINFNPIAVTQLEEGTPGTGTVQLSFATTNSVSAHIARIGGTATPASDFVFVGASANVTPGATSGEFTFAITDDDAFDPNETIIFSITGTTATAGANTNLTFTLDDTNDLPPLVRFVLTSETVLEGASASPQVFLSFTPKQNASVNVNPSGGTGSGADISFTEVPTLFAGGASGSALSNTVTVATVDDAIDETPYETIVLTLEDPTNCTLAAGGQSFTITIDDTNDVYFIPFAETFEAAASHSSVLGALDGQRGWVASATAVQTAQKYAGANAGLTTNSGGAMRSFTDGLTNVWTSLYVQPALGVTPSFPADSSVVVYAGTGGLLVAYNGQTEVAVVGGLSSNTFHQIVINSKYTGFKYDLYLDGVQVATNFGFYSNQTSYTSFSFESTNNNSTLAYWDNLTVNQSSPLQYFSITGEVETAGGNNELIVDGTSSSASYQIIKTDNDSRQVRTLLSTVANPPGNSFIYTDTGVMNNTTVTSRYYQVVEVGDETSTNDTVWVMQKHPRRSNSWHTIGTPAVSSSGDANDNSLHRHLGRQLKKTLTGTASFINSDQIWFWDYSKSNWSNAHVNASGDWTTPGGYAASNQIPVSQGFFVKTRGGTLRPEITNAAMMGVAFTATPEPIRLVSNQWILIHWPFINRQLEGDGTGATQGWGFGAGGKSGSTWDNSDNLFVVSDSGVPHLLYMSGGRWIFKGSSVTGAACAMQHGLGAYYYARGTNFYWTPTAAN